MVIKTNINLPNYSIEYTPTESHAGGTLLYISNNIAYKPRKDLNIYKTHELESTFINIFNLYFSTEVFPSGLKIAKVIPIHTKESKLKCLNYRPISLLSHLDKILEKPMHNRIYEFLVKYKLIYPLQFGFRQHYLTSYALLNLTE